MHDFTYYNNYVELVRTELSAVRSVNNHAPIESIAVLGSGPLPLTSICIFQTLEATSRGPPRIHNVDVNPNAIMKSSRLCAALGYAGKPMTFACQDALSDELSLDSFDVVYLAALVGTSFGEKHDIVARVAKRMRPGSLLVIRSAHSLRSLLYPVSYSHGHLMFLSDHADRETDGQDIGGHLCSGLDTTASCTPLQSRY